MPPNRLRAEAANLLAGLQAGLDPQFAMSQWGQIQQQAQAAQEARAQQQDQLLQLAVSRAQSGTPYGQVQTELETLAPHLGPNMSMQLDDAMTRLYPMGGQGPSSLAPPPEPAVPPFTAQSADDLSQATAGIIADALKTNPTAFPTIEQVKNRVAVMAPAEYGYYQQQADLVIEEAYRRLGGQMPTEGIPFLGSTIANAIPNRSP